jgi:hypothetical protein
VSTYLIVNGTRYEVAPVSDMLTLRERLTEAIEEGAILNVTVVAPDAPDGRATLYVHGGRVISWSLYGDRGE